jgi:hypothetical protein
MKLKIAPTILTASFYYALIRFVLWVLQLFFEGSAENLNFHYSNTFNWYIVWFVAPIVFAIFISKRTPNRFTQHTGMILLPLLVVGTIWGGSENKKRFGYFFKRPAIFSECRQVTALVSVSNIHESYPSEKKLVNPDSNYIYSLGESANYYYRSNERFIRALIDQKAISNIGLNSYFKTYNGEEFQKYIIPALNKAKSDVVGYGRLFGEIYDFRVGQDSFLYVGIIDLRQGQEDFYFYELLIDKSQGGKVLKSQKYLQVFDGPMEPPEYIYLAGVFEFIALVACILLVACGYFVNKIKVWKCHP